LNASGYGGGLGVTAPPSQESQHDQIERDRRYISAPHEMTRYLFKTFSILIKSDFINTDLIKGVSW